MSLRSINENNGEGGALIISKKKSPLDVSIPRDIIIDNLLKISFP